MADHIKLSSLPNGGVYDYYGRRYAVFSDTIEIYSITGDEAYELCKIDFKGRIANCLSWSHPIHSNYIAAGCDNYIYIWKETQANLWELNFSSSFKDQVCTLEFSPHMHGLNLLVGSHDRSISLITSASEHNWQESRVEAHSNPLKSVSWIYNENTKIFISLAEDLKIWQRNNGNFNIIRLFNGNFLDAKAGPNKEIFAVCNEKQVLVFYLEGEDWIAEEVAGANGYMVQWSCYGNIFVVCSKEKMYVIRQKPDLGCKWLVAQTIQSDGKIQV